MKSDTFELIKTSKTLQGATATLGQWSGSGKTKTEAIKDLLSRIAAEPEDTRPYVLRAQNGDLWVLYRQYGSWWYETPTGGACGLGGARKDAITAMVRHVGQYYPEYGQPVEG